METENNLDAKTIVIGIFIIAFLCVILWPLVARLLLFFMALTVIFMVLAIIVLIGKGILSVISSVSKEMKNDS